MGIADASINSLASPSSTAEGRPARAAVLAEDQRQFEMDFSRQTDLAVERPSAEDATEVKLALGDLDRLEGEITEVP